MCGIAALFSSRRDPASEPLAAVLPVLAHRGPDGLAAAPSAAGKDRLEAIRDD
jgi:asparagine synthetase B (glutamine-hydrolysing)